MRGNYLTSPVRTLGVRGNYLTSPVRTLGVNFTSPVVHSRPFYFLVATLHFMLHAQGGALLLAIATAMVFTAKVFGQSISY